MEKTYYLSTTFNNVVFKNRNKLYGAYYLRRTYSKHVLLAIVIATAVFTSLIAGPLIQEIFFTTPDKKQTAKDVIPERRVIDLPIIPLLPEEPKQAEQVVQDKQKVKTEIFAETKVVRDDAAVETKELADYEDLKNANFGTEKIEGAPPKIPDVTISDTPPAGLGSGTTKAEPEIFIYVEEMPEFKGGEKAMLDYIGKKMTYPAAAQRNSVEGLVVVTFIVSVNGTIEEAEVIKGLGFGTDEEALRVVKNMPKWKPGKQNGKAVPVRYTLPIRFSIR